MPILLRAGRLAAIAAVPALVVALTLASAARAAGTPRDPLDARQAYAGSSLSCLFANDFYAVHFSALQTGRAPGENSDFVKYCQEIPAIGKVFLSIDLLDRDARSLPIALRVVEEEIDTKGRLREIKSTLAETPAKTYRNGTAETHVDITHPGHYALIVRFGEGPVGEDDQLRIPFSVGLPPPTQYGKFFGHFTGAVVGLFFIVMAIIGLRTWQSYWPKGDRPRSTGDRPEAKPR